jgi:hypothetical protein
MDTEDPVIAAALAQLAGISAQARKLAPNEELMIKAPLIGLKKAELTINNGTYDLTFKIKAWWKDLSTTGGLDSRGRKAAHELPDLFWMDARNPGSRYGYSPVGIITPEYKPGDIPTWKFQLSNKPDHIRVTSPGVIFAAHLCFLRLSGVDIEQQTWTDATGRERQPTSKYEIQAVTSCMCCGRKLVKPSSIDLGFGPVCRKRIAEGFGYDTRVFQWVRPAT